MLSKIYQISALLKGELNKGLSLSFENHMLKKVEVIFDQEKIVI